MRKTKLILSLLCLIIFCLPSQAKWKDEYRNNSPEVQNWFKTLHAPNGQWCCDESDGHEYDNSYTLMADGSIKLHDGTIVPKDQVVVSPNKAGHAIWFYSDVGSERHTYCFVPGTLS